MCVAALLVAVLVARVVEVQGLGAAKYAAYGNSEVYKSATLPALRGSIYDRSGNLIAVSVPRVDVVSDDFLESDPDQDLGRLASLLGLPTATLHDMLNEHRGYVTLERQVDAKIEAGVQALDLPNLSFVPDPERVDLDGDLFKPLIGQVGFSGTGLSGLEYDKQKLLGGTAGTEDLAIGPGGEALPYEARDIVPAHQGDGLVLTLDQPLQFEVSKVLAAQLKATDANSGTVVVLDTRTGGILSMVNLVRQRGLVVPARQNAAVTSEYQAGSVMKLATISAALQDGIITPNERFTVPDAIEVGGWQFADADYHATESLPVSQILAQSSNVGTIEIATKLGANRLYDQLRDLGFGQATDLAWPGETAGYLHPLSGWSATAATMAIGTGAAAVTPLQVADAYNAVANDGVYVPPRLIQATVSPGGSRTTLPAPRTHRVLDASTIRELLPMLELVTSDGTAEAAQVPGYTVAGKTGTAQIPNGKGGYTPGAWMATFVGFVPAQQPQLTAVVVINHPNDYFGGIAAAPVFSTIMRYAVRHFGISPPASSGSPSTARP